MSLKWTFPTGDGLVIVDAGMKHKTYGVDEVFAPVTQIKQDVTSCRFECVGHGLEAVE
jgi:hypothetical protein